MRKAASVRKYEDKYNLVRKDKEEYSFSGKSQGETQKKHILSEEMQREIVSIKRKNYEKHNFSEWKLRTKNPDYHS